MRNPKSLVFDLPRSRNGVLGRCGTERRGNSCLTNFSWCGHEVNHMGRIWLDKGGYGSAGTSTSCMWRVFWMCVTFFYSHSEMRDSKSNILTNLVL